MPVEQIRHGLIIALCVVGFLLWQAWLQDYGSRRTPPEPATTAQPAPVEPGSAPAPVTGPDVPDLPPGEAEAPAPSVPVAEGGSEARRVRVETDTMVAYIDLTGGGLSRVELRGYPVSVDEPDVPFSLLTDDPTSLFIAQSGLLSRGAAPNHHAVFESARERYDLGEGAERLEVRLTWRGEGVRAEKIYTFHRGRHLVDVDFVVGNDGAEAWSGRMYGQFQRQEVVPEGGLFRTYTYTGGVLSSADKPYEKITFEDMAKGDLERASPGGWVAMIQHYFAGAWAPDQDAANHYYSKALAGARYVLGVITPAISIAPGEEGRIGIQLYAGPKVQAAMAEVAPHLERTVDYGWLWLIAEPLFWLLDWIHGFVGNWGWSIIILTLMVKLAFFHLSAASYRSMAKMRKLQPRLVTLRERYGEDKARLNQEMMKLYKEEKINPLGGCLPILVQIPVFISLYWVLLESVELRQASFIFWFNDLSVHDPYFVLPILMGVTMLAQQKLNPAPPDPMQAKIMMALPFVFTVLFLYFPSGLVLYWFVNNLLSIAQQWVITRKIVGTS